MSPASLRSRTLGCDRPRRDRGRAPRKKPRGSAMEPLDEPSLIAQSAGESYGASVSSAGNNFAVPTFFAGTRRSVRSTANGPNAKLKS